MDDEDLGGVCNSGTRYGQRGHQESGENSFGHDVPLG
jgi:hypothetical protein